MSHDLCASISFVLPLPSFGLHQQLWSRNPGLRFGEGDSADQRVFVTHKFQPTRVIELASLADAQTTTTDNEDLLDIDEVRLSLEDTAVHVALSSGGRLRQPAQSTGEGAQLLRAPWRRCRGLLLQSQTRRRRAGRSRLRSEGAQGRESGATGLDRAALTQESGRRLSATSGENHCALRRWEQRDRKKENQRRVN